MILQVLNDVLQQVVPVLHLHAVHQGVQGVGILSTWPCADTARRGRARRTNMVLGDFESPCKEPLLLFLLFPQHLSLASKSSSSRKESIEAGAASIHLQLRFHCKDDLSFC